MLLLNVGNSNTQLAEGDGDGVNVFNCRTVPTAELTEELFAKYDKIIGSTVVPKVKEQLKNVDILWLDNSYAAPLGLDLSQCNVSTLGADRLANAIGVTPLSASNPVVVFDFGTAITCEVVDTGGIFRGGGILAGRKLMRNALNVGTAQLPNVDFSLNAPQKIGVDTVSSITFGVDRGVIGAVKELLQMVKAQFGDDTVFVATGGDCKFFCQEIKEFTIVDELLTLRGTMRICEKF